MGEKSSLSASKGLKKSTFILYTVFVAKKDFKQTDLTSSSIYETGRKIRANFSICSTEEKKDTEILQPKGTQDVLSNEALDIFTQYFIEHDFGGIMAKIDYRIPISVTSSTIRRQTAFRRNNVSLIYYD